MIVTLADDSRLECEDKPFTEGGQGLLFWSTDGKHVIKLYKNLPDPQQRVTALLKIIGPEYSVVLGEPYWEELFAWPKAIIKDPALGLVMLRAPKGTMELRWFLGPKQRKVAAQKYGKDKLGNWVSNLSMAIKMARVVRRMHFRGLCHSDLSFRNFLVDPQHSRVVLIDCDGLVVPGFLPPEVRGTLMCMAPELMAQTTSPKQNVSPSAQTDLHALATLIYWLLFQRHPLIGPKMHSRDPQEDETLALGERALFIEDPNDTSNRPRNLPVPYTALLTPAVQELVKQALVEGLHEPGKRPQAASWERDLTRMADSIVPCTNPACPLQAFVLPLRTPVRCPGCRTPVTNPPFVPILDFYRPRGGRKGHFSDDRGYRLVGWSGRFLHVWHAYPGQEPGPNVDTNPLVAFEHDHRRGMWYLKNINLPEMQMLDRHSGHQDIKPGQFAELADGARLLLGPPDRARMAYVHMLRLK